MEIGGSGPRILMEVDNVQGAKTKPGQQNGVSTYKGLVGDLLVLIGRAERVVVDGKEHIVGKDSLKKFAFRHMATDEQGKIKDWKNVKIGDAIVITREATKKQVFVSGSREMTAGVLKEMAEKLRAAGTQISDPSALNALKTAPSNQPVGPSLASAVLSSLDASSAPSETQSALHEAQNSSVISNAQAEHKEAIAADQGSRRTAARAAAERISQGAQAGRRKKP